MVKSEHQESVALSDWLKLNHYTFTKSPNETYTKSWNQKRKNTSEGVSSGFPDYCIILKRGSLLFIELKKEKGPKGGLNVSTISSEQAKWVSTLDAIQNVAALFGHGCKDAIRIVMEMESK